MRGEVAGEDTLGAISHSLHVGGLGTWVARQRFCETALGFGSVSECLEQPFSGQHCSPPQHEEGARKGALNIACLAYFLASLPRLEGIPSKR